MLSGINLCVSIKYNAILGGASMGQYHYGVTRCLLEEGLIPRVISGSSSGSIFASLLCTKTLDELEAVGNFAFALGYLNLNSSKIQKISRFQQDFMRKDRKRPFGRDLRDCSVKDTIWRLRISRSL